MTYTLDTIEKSYNEFELANGVRYRTHTPSK